MLQQISQPAPFNFVRIWAYAPVVLMNQIKMGWPEHMNLFFWPVVLTRAVASCHHDHVCYPQTTFNTHVSRNFHCNYSCMARSPLFLSVSSLAWRSGFILGMSTPGRTTSLVAPVPDSGKCLQAFDPSGRQPSTAECAVHLLKWNMAEKLKLTVLF